MMLLTKLCMFSLVYILAFSKKLRNLEAFSQVDFLEKLARVYHTHK